MVRTEDLSHRGLMLAIDAKIDFIATYVLTLSYEVRNGEKNRDKMDELRRKAREQLDKDLKKIVRDDRSKK